MDQTRTPTNPLPMLAEGRPGAPVSLPSGNNGRWLDVHILYTTHSGTVAALKMASRLSTDLRVRPKVLLLYSVPYTLPLERPGVSTELLQGQIRALERESATEITARIILCREPARSLRQILPPHSLVVIGGRRRWWPTKEERLARMLRREGHQVVFASCE